MTGQDEILAYDRLLVRDPRNAELWCERGAVQMQMHRLDEALKSFNNALTLEPRHFAALVRRGNIRLMQKQPAAAITDYDRALLVQPDSAGALYNRGTAHRNLKQVPEALADYDRAMTLEPSLSHLEGARMQARLEMCDWCDYDRDSAALLAHVGAGKRAAIPFAILALPASPAQILTCAQTYARNKFPAAATPLWNGEKYAHDRIRIAYLCGGFGEHPVAAVLQDVLAAHDKSRFELTGISFLPDDGGPIRARIMPLFDRFIDATRMDDDQVARLVRSLEIDIVIDLDGFTETSRTAVLAKRAAPVQVNWLGFPATMGADYIDYVIVDAIVAPDPAFFLEKIVTLPGTFFPAENRPPLPPAPSRANCGLPETGFVFCAFNNNYKITPDIFDIWMRLLAAVDGSVLWLRQLNGAVKNNLRREAEMRGITADRLVFAPTLASRQDNIARQQLADIFLDTLYYNAHSTACDALWAGLPVVTCCGPAFAGRVAASLLHAIGMDELAMDSLDDYEKLALRLAQEPIFLAAMRQKLQDNRATTPLFDTALFTRNLENSYTAMQDRVQRGLPPETFAVALTVR